MGYQKNLYEWCVRNKIINDKQCTILFCVEYQEMSHVDPDIVSSVLVDIDV